MKYKIMLIGLLMLFVITLSGCMTTQMKLAGTNGYVWTGSYCHEVIPSSNIADDDFIYSTLNACKIAHPPITSECELRNDGVKCSIGVCKNWKCIPETKQTCSDLMDSCNSLVKPCCVGYVCEFGVCRTIPEQYLDTAPQNKDDNKNNIPDYIDYTHEDYQCSETDDGKDYKEKGTLTVGGIPVSDYCVNDNKLKEFYCDSGFMKDKNVKCSCDDGACVDTIDPSNDQVTQDMLLYIVIIAGAILIFVTLLVIGIVLVKKK